MGTQELITKILVYGSLLGSIGSFSIALTEFLCPGYYFYNQETLNVLRVISSLVFFGCAIPVIAFGLV